MEFGVRVPVSGPLATTGNIITAVQEAESLGFDTIWVHDQLVWSYEQNTHHVSSGSVEAVVPGQDPNFYESITTLSYLAAITKRVKLGVAIIVLPLRNPIVLAKQIMNLDAFSKGRLVLGVGAGAPLVGKTFDAVGASFEMRGEVTDDYLRALLALFDPAKRSTYNGKYAKFKDVEMFPKPFQKPHPPIIVGGLGRALRRAATMGDGWIPANITPADVMKGIEKIRDMAQKVGRGGVDFSIGNEIFTSVDRDSSTARQNSLATIGSYAKSIGRGGEEVTLVGSVSEVSKKVEDYVRAGVTMFELKFIYKDMNSFKSQLKLFSTEVAPSFK